MIALMTRTGLAMFAVHAEEHRPHPVHAGPPSLSFRYAAFRMKR